LKNPNLRTRIRTKNFKEIPDPSGLATLPQRKFTSIMRLIKITIEAAPEVLAHSAAGVGGKVLQGCSIRGCKRGTLVSHRNSEEKLFI
jgi:hypothetical protein